MADEMSSAIPERMYSYRYTLSVLSSHKGGEASATTTERIAAIVCVCVCVPSACLCSRLHKQIFADAQFWTLKPNKMDYLGSTFSGPKCTPQFWGTHALADLFARRWLSDALIAIEWSSYVPLNSSGMSTQHARDYQANNSHHRGFTFHTGEHTSLFTACEQKGEQTTSIPNKC